MNRNGLHEIFEKIQTGIVIIDPVTHTILDINPNALSLIGRAREDIIGRVCHQCICPALKGKCPITDLGQVIDNSERLLIDRDKNTIPILKTATTATIGGKNVIIESFIDIRDQKKAEDRKYALIGYIDETVMRVREPLVLVQKDLAEIVARPDTPAGSRDVLQAELKVEANRLEQIIQNLLEIQRAIAEERKEIPESYKAFIVGK
ncbi:MAG: hypothetical protein A4E42_01040 [Methanoregulaceae archaeon PtaU1.Bin222]|nr:MAG: hypothetical protein A4E42_01040 [Methanoregulaceae archaeon PtaU1.Bin222]